MSAGIISQIALDQLGSHGGIHLSMPATFHLNNDRQYVDSRVVWAGHKGIYVEINSFPWASTRCVTYLDLAQHNDPALLEIALKVQFHIVAERAFILGPVAFFAFSNRDDIPQENACGRFAMQGLFKANE